MKPIKKKKKQAYLLLEILVAIALVTLFVIPTVSFPMNHIKKQRKEILSLYLFLKAEELLNETEEKIRTGEISWDILSQSAQEKKFLLETLPPLILDEEAHFPNIKPLIFLKNTTIKKETRQEQGMTTVAVELRNATNGKKMHSMHSSFFITKKTLTPPKTPPPPT